MGSVMDVKKMGRRGFGRKAGVNDLLEPREEGWEAY